VKASSSRCHRRAGIGGTHRTPGKEPVEGGGAADRANGGARPNPRTRTGGHGRHGQETSGGPATPTRTISLPCRPPGRGGRERLCAAVPQGADAEDVDVELPRTGGGGGGGGPPRGPRPGAPLRLPLRWTSFMHRSGPLRRSREQTQTQRIRMGATRPTAVCVTIPVPSPDPRWHPRASESVAPGHADTRTHRLGDEGEGDDEGCLVGECVDGHNPVVSGAPRARTLRTAGMRWRESQPVGPWGLRRDLPEGEDLQLRGAEGGAARPPPRGNPTFLPPPLRPFLCGGGKGHPQMHPNLWTPLGSVQGTWRLCWPLDADPAPRADG